MLKKLGIAIIFIAFTLIIIAHAQEKKTFAPNYTMTEVCLNCHACKNPTPSEPCLLVFQSPGAKQKIGSKMALKDVPEEIILDELEKDYKPVKYPHKKHMHNSKVPNDCVDCHHFTSAGHPILACSKCHSLEKNDADIKQISLEAAYHRQCAACHLEWGKTTNCEFCHASKYPDPKAKPVEMPAFRDIKRPEKKLMYNRFFLGPIVTFFHQKHSKLEKVACVDCHENRPCVSCHYQNEERPSVFQSVVRQGVHGTCSLCHVTMGKETCVYCHANEERTEPKMTKK